MIIHAAKHYGVHATGVTISAQQREHFLKRVAAEGLEGRVEVRLQDYREVSDEPFDAISTIEMGEHVGESNYPTHASTLHRLLKQAVARSSSRTWRRTCTCGRSVPRRPS